MRPRLAALAAAALLVLPAPLLAACAGRAGSSSDVAEVTVPRNTTGYTGALLDEPRSKPSGVFTDTSGRPFDWAATRPVTIVFLGYTHCPDECPTTMAGLASALRRIDGAVRAKVEVVVLTTDPARDSAPVLRSWLDRFDPTFVGLRADARTVSATAARLAIPLVSPTEHGSQLVGFRGSEGRLIWSQGVAVRDLRADIERLAR